MNRSACGFAAFLLTGSAAVAAPAGAPSIGQAATDAKVEKLEQQLRAMNAEIADLKHGTKPRGAGAVFSPTSSQPDEVQVKLDNGRPTFTTADGQFSLGFRTLVQLDWATYMQGARAAALPAAYGPDLSSGANFRRVYVGLQGKAFGDWSYNVNFDFGGSSGTEAPGHIQSVYLEYDGLAPFALRVGAYPASANLEDGTASGDTLFLERNAPSDLQRNLAAGDGRDAVSILYEGERLFGALSFTGDKIQETGGVFGEQEAIVGRASDRIVATPDVDWLVGVNGTYVAKFPGALARGTAFPGTTLANGSAFGGIALSDPPELSVDENGIRLVNTAFLAAKHLTQWGVETAARWGSLYGQGGYYDFELDRAAENFTVFTASGVSHAELDKPSSDRFAGWYAQASWVLSGEQRTYVKATGGFAPPKPDAPFALDGSGWGAFELAGRFSDLNLNDRRFDAQKLVTAWSGANKTYTFFNTVRGGDQRITTVALNWYPNVFTKFSLQYQYSQISRLISAATPSTLIVVGPTSGTPTLPAVNAGQNFQTIALRVQFAL